MRSTSADSCRSGFAWRTQWRRAGTAAYARAWIRALCRHSCIWLFVDRAERRTCARWMVEVGLAAGVGSGGAAAAEDLPEILPGVAALRLGHLLRRACRDDAAALVAALRADVHDPVGPLDHVEVVLDHQHGVARLDQPVEHVQETLDVLEVKAGGGLVEDVERSPGVGARQLAGELDALRFAAAQGR